MDIKEIDRDDAKCRLENKVYQSSSLIEELEMVGKIIGNGHHIRQELCKYAGSLIDKYWKGKDCQDNVSERRATELEYLEWFRVNVDLGPSEGDAIDQMNAEFQRETGKNLPEGWNYDSSGEINDKI